jgi:hypothetical protein
VYNLELRSWAQKALTAELKSMPQTLARAAHKTKTMHGCNIGASAQGFAAYACKN